MDTVHRDGCCQSEHSVIQNGAVLPFRKKTLSVQRPELSMAQPNSGQIRGGVARASHRFDTHHPVFAAVALRPFHAQLVEAPEIVLGDGWYGSAFFCRFDESFEGLQPLSLLIRHLRHPSRELEGQVKSYIGTAGLRGTKHAFLIQSRAVGKPQKPGSCVRGTVCTPVVCDSVTALRISESTTGWVTVWFIFSPPAVSNEEVAMNTCS